jgi:mannose-6-phosphate isomerase class I
VIQKGSIEDTYSTIYVPPIPEFMVKKFTIAPRTGPYTPQALPVPSILIVVQGYGNVKYQKKNEFASEGDVFFLKANETASFSPFGAAKTPFLIFQSSENLFNKSAL